MSGFEAFFDSILLTGSSGLRLAASTLKVVSSHEIGLQPIRGAVRGFLNL